MDNADMIYQMSTFLTLKELFMFSRVSLQWKKSLEIQKEIKIQTVISEVSKDHLCDNICACTLEKFFENHMKNFFLKRNICRLLEGKEIPLWLKKYKKKKIIFQIEILYRNF